MMRCFQLTFRFGWLLGIVAAICLVVACSSGGSSGGKGGGKDKNGDGDGGGDGGDEPLVWVQFSTFQDAAVVIGQDDFVAYTQNAGGTTSDSGMASPSGGVWVHDGILYVVDSANNRVLGYDPVPTTNGESAAFAVGQSALDSSSTGTAANQMEGPWGLQVDDDGRLFTVEWVNSRVLIFDPAPVSTNASADQVLGQSTFGAAVPTCDQDSLNDPEALYIVGDKLIVADRGQHRVLIWNSIPADDGAAADMVLGQGDFTHCTVNDDDHNGTEDLATARTMFFPQSVWSDGTRLLVADSGNNRVLLWTSFPTSDFAPADLVLGQTTLTGFDPGTSATALAEPVFVYSNGIQIFVADRANNRVLIWNEFPTENGAAADVVLGQGDFAHAECDDADQDDIDDGTADAKTLCGAWGLHLYGNQLFVSDKDNNRVLIFEGTEVEVSP